MTIAIDWLEKRAQLSPNNIALIDRVTGSGREVTYKRWNLQVNQTAHFFREKLGLQKGDRIAILASNCIEYLDVLFACNKLGTILQNLNWRLAVPELEHLIKDAKPKILIYSNDFIDQVEKLKKRADIQVENYIAFEDQIQKSDLDFFERNNFRDTTPDAPAISDQHPWLLCYTGGTTGLPKAAIHTYANVVANAVNTITSWELHSQDCAILNAPLFHTGGLHVFTTPLVYSSGSSIICKAFDVEQTFDFVKEKRATVFFGVPTMFIMMQNHPRWKEAAFNHMKFIISGGAPCPLSVCEEFWKKNVDFKTGYGLTEAGPNTFWLPKDLVQNKPGSVGFPLMHVETKLVDKNHLEIEDPDIHGELWIRGPHRTPGYRNNPQATEDAIDSEGWLHTGDLARRDDDGCYYVVGRKKDMYISGGENVYPLEIESALQAHEYIAEAAVFGVPHKKWGEVGRAVVALVGDAPELTEEDIIEYMRNAIAHYKVPHRVCFTDALPKTAAGKVSKTKLRELFGVLDSDDDRRQGRKDRRAGKSNDRRGACASDET
ncbi:MAG: long-chain fatty acid--CoA ligase [Gammaproteobacteria bacterium]|nr:MAG: long-chain fatty acid--CoA ligase [Gammaproteobacteria bacterium]